MKELKEMNEPEIRNIRFHGENYERCYYIQKLKPIQAFLKARKENNRLHLNELDKKRLIGLVKESIGVDISFEQEALTSLEALDLAISLFVNTSEDRAEILNTTAGSLRNISLIINHKLNANNRFHAMLIAVQRGIIRIP